MPTQEPFDVDFYTVHLREAWAALAERRPYTVNADGAIALIQQAASDRIQVRQYLTPEKVLDAAATYLLLQYGASYGLDNKIDRERILKLLRT